MRAIASASFNKTEREIFDKRSMETVAKYR